MKSNFFYGLLLTVTAVATSPAAVTLFAEFHLGEIGSLGARNLPLDSSGNNINFDQDVRGVNAAVLNSGVVAPGSTAYLSTAAIMGEDGTGWFGADFSSLSTDNFAMGIYVRSFENSLQTRGAVFLLGGTSGFGFLLATNGWSAGSYGTADIGPNAGAVGSFTANTWAHLAVIRDNGTSTFYINGVAQTSTYAGAPVHADAHLSLDPGATNYFNGDMDEARVVTFTAGESTSNVLDALQGVPEPSSAFLVALGGITLLLRRRRVHPRNALSEKPLF